MEVSEISRPSTAGAFCGGRDRNFSDCRVSMVQAQFVREFNVIIVPTPKSIKVYIAAVRMPHTITFIRQNGNCLMDI